MRLINLAVFLVWLLPLTSHSQCLNTGNAYDVNRILSNSVNSLDPRVYPEALVNIKFNIIGDYYQQESLKSSMLIELVDRANSRLLHNSSPYNDVNNLFDNRVDSSVLKLCHNDVGSDGVPRLYRSFPDEITQLALQDPCEFFSVSTSDSSAINIYLIEMPSTFQGFGSYPSDSTVCEGLILNINLFANGADIEVAVGVLIHELGHYLGLVHPWDALCGDDGIADTPIQQEPSSSCPIIQSTSCGSEDMDGNFMNYTHSCSSYFTVDQYSLMMNVLYSYRKSKVKDLCEAIRKQDTQEVSCVTVTYSNSDVTVRSICGPIQIRLFTSRGDFIGDVYSDFEGLFTLTDLNLTPGLYFIVSTDGSSFMIIFYSA